MTLWSDPSHVRFHGCSGVGFATQHCRMANLAPKCHAEAMTQHEVLGMRLIRKSSFRLIAKISRTVVLEFS